MEAVYKRDLNGTWLIMEVQGIREKDYQVYMMESNPIEGFIEMQVQGVNNVTQYCYNISGKNPISALYERNGMKADEIRQLIFQILTVVSETELYLLNADKILLEPEYIFYANGSFFFCYDPCYEGTIHEAFHRLTEYVIRQVDCDDKEGIYLAYELHKATMEENYCLSECVEKILGFTKTEIREEEELLEEEEPLQDEFGNFWLRETKTKWKGAQGLFRRRKERRWGDFDDFYVEEEEL